MFTYTLIEKGKGTYSGRTAKTTIKAIYIEPKRCKLRNLYLETPSARPKVGELATAHFEAIECKKASLQEGSWTLFDRTDPNPSVDFNGSRTFALPKALSVTVTLEAEDAMHVRTVPPRSASIGIDPCSISPTHEQCDANCTANPTDSRCPANCTAAPSDPRCATQCPRTPDNPNGEWQQWNVGEWCGGPVITPVVLTGCTYSDAVASVPPHQGCTYTTLASKPVGECPSGLAKEDFDMCLSCTLPPDNTAKDEYAIVRRVCTLDEAKTWAIAARQPRTCQFKHTGECP